MFYTKSKETKYEVPEKFFTVESIDKLHVEGKQYLHMRSVIQNSQINFVYIYVDSRVQSSVVDSFGDNVMAMDREELRNFFGCSWEIYTTARSILNQKKS